MKKLCAFIFVLCYVVTTAIVHAETMVLDGKTLKCSKTSIMSFTCQSGNESILVMKGTGGYSAVVKQQDGIFLKEISKVSDGDKVLFQKTPGTSYEDTKVNRLLAAKTIIYTMKGVDDPVAKKAVLDAETFISKESAVKPNLKVSLAGSDETYQCTRGSSAGQMKAEPGCEYYACKGKNPTEKVLMYLPIGSNSFKSPSIISMNNGQAKLIEGGYKITDESSLPVTSVAKQQDQYSLYPNNFQIDPNLLIPSKYDQSKSSFNYLKAFADGGFQDDGAIAKCGSDLAPLFSEQKKIAEEMQKSVAEADLVEYLKLIDGTVHSFYVDRKKGMSLGCIYQDKVVDSGVLGKMDHLKAISQTKPVKKYLSVTEVQKLFDEAKNMKDIPFGYKYDGCYARAHIMARRFEEKGIVAQKVWIKGALFVPGTDIEWNYHVAPVVEVKKKDGKIEKYVIDPSLTDKAVPVDEWVAAMGKKVKGPTMKTTYPFPDNVLDFDRTVVAISPTDVFAPMDILDTDLTEGAKMAMSKQVLEQFTRVLAEQGK